MPRIDRSAPSALGDVSLLLTVAILGAVFIVLLVKLPGPPEEQPARRQGASQDFFADYVDPDGRVIRRDQGGDTVSEGQAQALRLALGDGDAAEFDRVWSWTRDHLQLSSGLFAWRWLDGAIADGEPVADADVDVAVALAEASHSFGRDDYADEARRVASAVLDHETVEVGRRLVLVAGPWAVAERFVNPSYLAPCDHEELAALSDDPRWLRLRDSSAALLDEELSTGLPSDWAILDASGAPHAIAGPEDTAGPGRYGLDAARVPARLWGCDTGRALAARLWDRLEHLAADGAYSAYALDGTPVDTRPHPLGLIAGALTAGAVGERTRAEDLIGLAARLEHTRPSSYGAAWLGLADDLLATISIGIPGAEDLPSEEVADGASSAPPPASAEVTVPPVWWPAPAPEQTATSGSLSVNVVEPTPFPQGQSVPFPSPPHPPPPTAIPPPPPTTPPPTTPPPTTPPPTTEPPTTEPPTTAPPTTEPPTTDPPSSTTD